MNEIIKTINETSFVIRLKVICKFLLSRPDMDQHEKLVFTKNVLPKAFPAIK